MTERRSIIQEAYADDLPPLRYRVFIPTEPPRARPLVVVHGAGRGAASVFHAVLPSCMAAGRPLIAPTFSEDNYSGYQWLGGAPGPLSAAHALTRAVAQTAETFGLAEGKFDLLGSSGGGQFAHRYAMLNPSSVAQLVVIAAGWYTYLEDLPFPTGIRASKRSAGAEVDVNAFLAIPTLVMVGERDQARDGSLRTGPSVDRRQGPNRLARALRWIDHLEEESRARGLETRAWFDVLPGVGHSFTDAVTAGGLVERAVAFLDTGAGTADLVVGADDPEQP